MTSGPESGRTEDVPRLLARHNWKRYAAGMAAEVAYVLVLAALALAVALAAVMVR